MTGVAAAAATDVRREKTQDDPARPHPNPMDRVFPRARSVLTRKPFDEHGVAARLPTVGDLETA